MVIGRANRRKARQPRFEREFGSDANAALDLIDLTERAWHDSYGEPTFPDKVLDDLLLLANGSVHELIAAALLAVTDWRDLRMAADTLRT